jgi:hypothetical protein
MTITIVGFDEADLDRGQVSWLSPIASGASGPRLKRSASARMTKLYRYSSSRDGKPRLLGSVSWEDSVIEHDARHLPGFDLVGSDITGRAVFTKDRERLEIFTANRRPLEHVFGVDLIYLNATR